MQFDEDENGRLIYRDEECHCPSCDAKIDAATGTDHNELPKEGDISICLYCGKILTFNKDIKVVGISDQQYTELDFDTKREILRLQKIIIDRSVDRGSSPVH
jgi:hypothetical protein